MADYFNHPFPGDLARGLFVLLCGFACGLFVGWMVWA